MRVWREWRWPTRLPRTMTFSNQLGIAFCGTCPGWPASKPIANLPATGGSAAFASGVSRRVIGYVPFKFELVDFRTRMAGRPFVNRHAVSGDHHPRAVVAVTAVHENLLLRVVPKQLKKLRNRLFSRKPAVPGDGNVFHAQPVDRLLLRLFAGQADVHDNVDPQLR